MYHIIIHRVSEGVRVCWCEGSGYVLGSLVELTVNLLQVLVKECAVRAPGELGHSLAPEVSRA